MLIAKIIVLFIGVLFTFSNTYRIMARNDLPAITIILQSIAITAFVVLQWLI